MTSAYEEKVIPAQELLDVARAAASTPERQRTFVRELSGKYSDIYKKLIDAPRVIPASSKPWAGGPQMYGKTLIDPDSVDFTQLFHCHFELLAPGAKSQKHGHMNTAAFYILEGDGYDVHDGKKYPWQAGDVCIVEPGCVHQHFNADDANPAKMLIMKSKPVYLFANLGFQGFVERAPKEPLPGFEDWLPQEVIDQGGPVDHGYSGG
ncbi:MAG TPA: cupin domain-containing protein [Acidimicrobiales bacterium]|nr:cupin domain-containing protein [Acidimicrobiales bacterium]